MNDSRQQLSGATLGLHWVVAVTVLFVVVLVRVVWRLGNGWPQPVGVYPRFEQVLARVVYWTLIVTRWSCR